MAGPRAASLDQQSDLTLSIVRPRGEVNLADIADQLYNFSLVPGLAAFPVWDQGSVLIATNCPTNMYICQKFHLLGHEVSTKNTELAEQGLANLFSILDFWINRSDRWRGADDLWPKPEVFYSETSGSTTILAQNLLVEFFDEDQAKQWLPPDGTKVVSKMRSFLTLSVESLEALLKLDNDLRIERFEISKDAGSL